jgi:Holliday junction resolvase RusA-like endonuclease
MASNTIAITLKGIKPTPLNRLYTPIVKYLLGKPIASMLLSKESRTTKKLIQTEVLRQKQNKMLDGHLLFYMDIDVKKVKSPDIDALLKQLFDALEGLCYKNDNQILDLRVRKHLNQEEDKITIFIEKLDVNQEKYF